MIYFLSLAIPFYFIGKSLLIFQKKNRVRLNILFQKLSILYDNRDAKDFDVILRETINSELKFDATLDKSNILLSGAPIINYPRVASEYHDLVKLYIKHYQYQLIPVIVIATVLFLFMIFPQIPYWAFKITEYLYLKALQFF